MKNDANSKSFRRNKVIEEMAPQRRAEALASTQNDELENISDVLKENQAASEMAAEAIEQKGNQIISAIDSGNKSLADIQAGVELASEGIEKASQSLKSNVDATRAISDKLSKLTDMLAEKLNVDPVRMPSSESTTLAAINEALPLKVEEPKLQELLEKMLPQHPIPQDAPFLPHPDDEKPQNDNDSKEGKEKFEFNFGEKLEALTKVSKQGFNKVVSVSDSIASMLFRYTVTAAAQAAKLAASLFGLVLGIDMIRVYFQYFMKKFDENWATFDEKFKEWGPLITSLLTMAKNVTEMFNEGNWLKLGESILVGMTKVTAELANLLFLGLGKLGAAILRAMGKDEWADEMEGNSLQNYQQKTGAKLDPEDQQKLAKYQDKKEQEKFEGKKKAEAKFKDASPEALNNAVKYGSVGKETADEIRSGEIKSSYMNMPEDQRLEVIKKRNEAQASIIRLTKKAEQIMSPTETDIKNAKEEYAAVKEKLADPELSKAPTDLNTTQLLEKLDKSLEKFNTTVKPVPVDQTPDAQQVKRVDEGIKAKEASRNNTQTPQATMNQQVNIKKSSKTQYNMPPQSSTPAPGMHRSVNVN